MIRIIGAGFSGLSLAYHFVKAGIPVTIVEKNKRSGGVIQSRFEHNMLVESAANGLLASQKIEDLFADIGLEPLETKSESRKKYIYRNGMRRWPLSFSETIELILRVAKAFLTRQRKPLQTENLKQWAERVLGPAGNDYLIQPMVNGIFAESTERLSAEIVLSSMFFKKTRGKRKGLISAKGGMGELIEAMERFLHKKGAKFIYEHTETLNLKNMKHNTFYAVDFSFLKSISEPSSFQNNSIKKEGISALSLVRATVNFKRIEAEIDGFGVLFPNCEKFNALGVLANSKIFENRGDYNESWIFSDSTQPGLMDFSYQEILDRIIQDRKRMFGDTFEVNHIIIHRWPEVIPSYNFALQEFLRLNESIVSNCTGNFMGVLGLTGIHERNAELVQEYLKTKMENKD